MTAEPSDSDLWSWVDAEPESRADVPGGEVVTAVMVVRNGELWVRDALRALAVMDVRPGRVLVVDNGSTDATADHVDVEATRGRIEVVAGRPSWGFGRSVAEALAVAEADTPTESDAPEQWLWLLHDDTVVAPDALRRLLEHTVRYPDADVIGPMLVKPGRRIQARIIAELGVSISDTGRRELGLEPGEVAQGQHEPKDTLGVSTCGMLVRRSVYDELGGFDEAVPIHRDGVEFGWRATAAGHRVMTCPSARITHWQAGRTGRRVGTLAAEAGRTPASYDRLMAMRTVAAHSSGLAAIPLTLRLLVGSMVRAIGFVLGKRLDLAGQEVRVAGDFVRSASAVRRLRRRVRALTPTPESRRAVRRLRPPPWSSAQVAVDGISRWASDRFRGGSGRDSASLDELTGDDFADSARRQQRGLLPLLGALAAVVAVLVANRRVIGLGDLVSTGLLPAPGSVAAAVSSYVTPPPGHDGTHPAWLGLAALTSAPLVVPGWAPVVALLLGVPIAAFTCAWYLEPYVSAARARWLTAVLYALLPVLVGGYSRGQVWLVVWTVVLPVFGVAVRTWGLGDGIDAWRPAAGAALSLAVLTAIAPLALPIGAACLVAVAVRRGRGRARALLAAGAVIGLMSPWWPALVRSPGRLLTGPEPLLGDLSASPAWGIFVGRTAGPGLPPLWLSVAIVGLLCVGALVAMALRPTAWGVWAGALGCLTLAVGLSRFLVDLPGGHARPEVTMWLVAGLGLLLSGSATAVDRARLDLAEADFGIGQWLVVASTVLGTAALVLSLGWWLWGGVREPLTRAESSTVPTYVRDATSAQGSRALLVTMDSDQVRWFVDEPGAPVWGSGEYGLVLAGAPEAVAKARSVVAQVASGRQTEGLATDLATLGISHVKVSGATPEIIAALGSTPGLQRGTDDSSGSVWLVAGKPATRQVVDGASLSYVTTTVAPGGSARILVLSEADDPRRVVTVGGARLEAAISPDWRAAYALGSASGPLDVRLDNSSWWAWAQVAALGLMALFAAPSLRRETDDVPVAAPRRAGGSTEVLE